MKKHLITATFAVAIAAMAGYNTYLSHVEDGMSDMVLENVEALADDTENGSSDDSILNYGLPVTTIKEVEFHKLPTGVLIIETVETSCPTLSKEEQYCVAGTTTNSFII